MYQIGTKVRASNESLNEHRGKMANAEPTHTAGRAPNHQHPIHANPCARCTEKSVQATNRREQVNGALGTAEAADVRDRVPAADAHK